jgi:uncharacterized membrane protein YtjA (UPF0391 family)
MLGWMISFALIALIALTGILTGAGAGAAKTASILFSGLFVLCLITRAVRGRA